MRKFKNDIERKQFLDDYRNEQNGWFLWKNDDDLERRWWRYDLPDGTSLIVEEEKETFHWPNKHIKWEARCWYVALWKNVPFSDYRASKTQALAKIKEIGKRRLEMEVSE